MMPVRRLSLTDFKSAIPRGAREKTLKLALEKDGIVGKWEATAWAKKLIAKDARSKMSDFDRFKLMVAKRKRSAAVKKSLRKSKWEATAWAKKLIAKDARSKM